MILVAVLHVFVLLGSVCASGDKMVIYEYPHPETQEAMYRSKNLASGEDLRQLETNQVPSNEIPIEVPKNFTTEEYTFTLFSWSHRMGTLVSENSSIEELQSLMDPSLDTKIVVHGWLSSADSYIVNNTIKEYLDVRNLNAIAVDWSSLAGWKFYPLTTYSVAPVGKGVAKLVLRMLEARVTTMKKVHLIGHSLGAHVMGIAGWEISKKMGGRVSRISGLDPASPMYEIVGGKTSRLDPSDAEFVDVIHTAGGVAGYYSPLGQVDFYPNGGTPLMPGCGYSQIGCSHGMAYRYYDESISNSKGFRAVQCNSWSDYSNGSCDENNVAYMGDPTSPSVHGTYYLSTNDQPPYAKG